MNSADTIPGRPSQNGLTVHPEKIRAAREFLIEVNPDAVERADVVLSYLLDLGPDDDATIAGMIFAARVPLDTHGKIIQERFGVGVEKLLGFLYKVHTLRPDFSRNDTEVLRQVILMMAQDIRVMLVRLADRLCEMKTLDTFSHEEQKQISQESLKIYAPVASRLGMYSMKWQLEDLAFANLNPSQYESITRQLEQFGRARRLALDDFERETIEFLHQRGVVCRITSRTKSVYSIYRKMRRKSTDQITDLHDIFAIRIIVPTVMGSGRESTELLYSLLGMIHNEWTPIPGRFKDYIAVPKPNGYQSLHTAIFTATPGLKNQPVEIQIRSEKMHREAEYGIAAHWLYESTRAASTQIEQRLVDGEAEGASESSMMSDRLKRQLDWLRGLVKSHDDEIRSDSGHTDGDTQDFRIDIFHDRIFVFTPNGEVKDLPVGATPVDFAYSVHTDIGHRCAMARVNGGIVPLNAILKNGDVIDVVLKPKPNPRSEWLSFVKTTSARQKIKIWFKSQNRELSLREGRDLINKHLRRLNKAALDDQMSIFKVYGGKTLSVGERQKVLEGVGSGSIPVNTVMKKLFSFDELMQPLVPVPLKVVSTTLPIEKKILLGGEAGLPVRIAQCCLPEEGQRIVGYVTREHASIHRIECNHLQSSNPARILEARWVTGQRGVQKYSVRVMIEGVNRIGLIRDITSIIADMNINILDFSLRHQDESFVTRSLLLEIDGYEQLDDILRRLEGISGVVNVMREESREHRWISAPKRSVRSKALKESD